VPELRVGEKINRRYQIERFVAAGGFGEVYQAQDPRLNVKVAVKILKDTVRTDPAARNDFLSEAQRQAQLRDHPHVVTVLDVDEVEHAGQPFPFCVLEWLPGGTLQQFVPAGGARPNIEQVSLWIGQTSDALAAAAGRSLIHRDVKPGNIFRDERGNAKLADFGLAKMVTRNVAQVSQAIGTLAFMPPEQFVVGGAITPAADVFALGVTLWLMISGKLPLPQGSQALNNPTFVLPRLRATVPACPQALDELVNHMLAADPKLRPTAAEVAQALLQGRSTIAPAVAGRSAGPSTSAQTGVTGAPASTKGRGLLSGWNMFRSGSAGRAAVVTNHDAIAATERAPTGITVRSLDQARPTPRAEGAPGQWTDPQEDHPLPAGVSLCLGSPRFRHGSTVNAVAITPDGTRAVAGCEDKSVRVWDLLAGQEVLCMPGHSGGIASVAVTSDGKFAVSAGLDKTLRVWDLMTGQERAMLQGHTDAVRGVAITPNGRAIISASGDRSVQVWDLESGRDLFWLGRHTGPVHSVAVTPDGRFVATGGADSTLRLWNLESRQEVYRIEGDAGIIYAIAITPDGKRALTGAWDQTITMWDLDDGREIQRLAGHTGAVVSLAVTPDGRRAISASHDGVIKVWDLQTGLEVASLEGHNGSVNDVALTPDGRFVVSGSDDRTLRIWNLETLQEHRRIAGHTRPVSTAAISPDGRLALSGSWDKTLRVWELEDGAERCRLEGHTSIIYAAAVTADARHAISASGDSTLRLWLLESGREIGKMQGHKGAVRAVALLPDGRRALSGGDDRTLRLWSLDDLSLVREIDTGDVAIFGLAMVPDGRRALIVAGDQTMRVWDLQSGKERRKLVGHTGNIHTATVSPNGKYVVSGAADHTVRVWDVESGKERRKLVGHQHNVYSLGVTADNRYIVSVDGSPGGAQMKVWDLERGQLISTLTNPFSPVCLALSPDANWVLTGNSNTSLTLYPLAALLMGDGSVG